MARPKQVKEKRPRQVEATRFEPFLHPRSRGCAPRATWESLSEAARLNIRLKISTAKNYDAMDHKTRSKIESPYFQLKFPLDHQIPGDHEVHISPFFHLK